jgi:hypothetical protein
MIFVTHGLGSTKTSLQYLLLRMKAWFAEYLRRFDSDDPTFQENIDLKAEPFK